MTLLAFHSGLIRRRPHAFTLIELLVVLGVAVLLGAILMPALAGTLASTRSAKCLVNLRSLGQSTTLYRNDHADLYPAAGAVVSLPLGLTALLDALAPYVDSARVAMGPDGVCVVPVPFRCPADRVCAPAHGMSYLYGIGEIIEVLAIDGDRRPGRAATRIADSDPNTVVFSDMGDRELALLRAPARWHDGPPIAWRNAVYSDGRGERRTVPPEQVVAIVASR